MLDGGEGDDTLVGGVGADILDGGAGGDKYQFSVRDSVVTIGDTVSDSGGANSNDELQFIGSDYTASSFAFSTSGTDEEDLVITITTGAIVDTVTIEDFTSTTRYAIKYGVNGTENTVVNLRYGTTGADTGAIVTGAATDDYLFGRGGNDELDGGAGADRIDGGAGRDTALYTNVAQATTAVDGFDGVIVDLSDSSNNDAGAQGDTLISIENVRGSAFKDKLTGDNNANVLEGGAGGDTIDGGAGVDTAVYTSAAQVTAVDGFDGVIVDLSDSSNNDAGAQGDTLISIENVRGSAFKDKLTGDGNANVLEGGAGGDTIDGGAGADRLYGGAGGDTIDGGAGADRLYGGAGADKYQFSAGDSIGTEGDTIADSGTGSNDELQFIGADYTASSFAFATGGTNGENLVITITMGTVADGNRVVDKITINNFMNTTRYSIRFGTQAVLDSSDEDLATVVNLRYGTTGHDTGNTLTGTGEGDYIFGLVGNDELNGMAGNDMLVGGAGEDTIDGGGGVDTASYASYKVLGFNEDTLGVTVMLGDNGAETTGSEGDAAGDTLRNIENLIGTDYRDTLTGNNLVNILEGGKGVDTLDGGAGADIYRFYVGDSTGTTTDGKVGDSISGTGSNEIQFIGTEYSDSSFTFATSVANENVVITITTGGITDTVTINAAVSTRYAIKYGANGTENTVANVIYGSDNIGNNVESLSGANNVDHIFGRGGFNRIRGNGGDDVLYGGDGGDTISGEDGNDTFIGGKGGDFLGSTVSEPGSDIYKFYRGDSMETNDTINDGPRGDDMNYVRFIDPDNIDPITGTNPDGYGVYGEAMTSTTTNALIFSKSSNGENLFIRASTTSGEDLYLTINNYFINDNDNAFTISYGGAEGTDHTVIVGEGGLGLG